jgi:transcriptional regulator with XRE-family HTH domain
MERQVKRLNTSVYRKIKKITQIQMSKELGVSTVTLSSWETGKSLPNINQLYKISKILGVQMEELLGWE